MNVSDDAVRDALTPRLDGRQQPRGRVVHRRRSATTTRSVTSPRRWTRTPARSRARASRSRTFGADDATLDSESGGSHQVPQRDAYGMTLIAGGGIAESGRFDFDVSRDAISNEGTNPNITLFQGISINSGIAASDGFVSTHTSTSAGTRASPPAAARSPTAATRSAPRQNLPPSACQATQAARPTARPPPPRSSRTI